MTNGWIKFFVDGTTESGSDEKVQLKQASWSRGKLDSIIKTELSHDNFTICLRGQGNYWQSDDWETDILGNSKILTRRLAKQIEIKDNYIYVRKNSYQQEFAFSEDIPREPWLKMHTIITPELTHQWFVLELSLTTNLTTAFFSKEKI